jgi:hypothetical protein
MMKYIINCIFGYVAAKAKNMVPQTKLRLGDILTPKIRYVINEDNRLNNIPLKI